MGKQRSEAFQQRAGIGFDGALRFQTGDGPIQIFGMTGHVDADAGNDGVARPLQQDTGDFCAVDQYVVGPFDPGIADAQGRNQRVNCIGGDERQCMRGRITSPHPDQCGRMKVACRAFPMSTHPPATAGLPAGAEPTALGRALLRQCQHVGIGGAGFGYEADQCQKSDAAAAALTASSAGFSRYPKTMTTAQAVRMTFSTIPPLAS